jgi:hypothetical protein
MSKPFSSREAFEDYMRDQQINADWRSNYPEEKSMEVKQLEQECDKWKAKAEQYHAIAQRLLVQVDVLLPGIRHIVVQDFGELNDVLVTARKILEEKIK